MISAGQLSAKATVLHIMCKSCRHNKTIPVNGGFAGVLLPRICDREPLEGEERKDCPIDPFMIIHDKSQFVDQQTLKLQEVPESVPIGELPRHLVMSADRYATNMVIPGSRVTVTGIFTTMQQKNGVRLGTTNITE